jgi:hypothetical protein|tara:strand:+ start:6841 stop:7356 length:516 start_codon:yes stop_codon:yes gene_type:complete
MIRAYPFKPYNDDLIVEYLQDYVKKNPCCFKYPNCTHPPHQSDPNVFNTDNPTLQYIKKHYFKFLNDVIGPYIVEESKAWVLNVEKNTNTLGVWHKHFEEKHKDNIQISGICYISSTKIGTEFDLNHCTLQIKPMSCTWYIWDSKDLHRPMEGIQNTDRVILATQTALNKL